MKKTIEKLFEWQYNIIRGDYMEILSFINLSGGSCKTTSCSAFADALAYKGYKVLIIDMNLQGDLTTQYNIKNDYILKDRKSIFEAMDDGSNIKECYIKPFLSEYYNTLDDKKAKLVMSANPVVIPSKYTVNGKSFVDFLDTLSDRDKDYTLLLKKLCEIDSDSFDFILIDCHDIESTNLYEILVATDDVIVPCQLQEKYLDGLKKVYLSISKLKKALGEDKVNDIFGVFINKYGTTNKDMYQNKDAFDKLEMYCNEKNIPIMKHLVREYTSLGNTRDKHKSILCKKEVEYKKAPDGSKIEYSELTLDMIGKPQKRVETIKNKRGKKAAKFKTIDFTDLAKDYITLVDEYLGKKGFAREKSLIEQLDDIIKRED